VIEELDRVVRESLSRFVEGIFQNRWLGREREAISLYAFGYLQNYCKSESFLRDPTQIGIEVAVPQLKQQKRKNQVCKDLVIWPEPGTTCWDQNWQPVHHPVAILEWKANSTKVSEKDVDWLREFSTDLENFIGYALCLDLDNRNFRLKCARIRKRKVIPDWLIV
jgi:hypothetical protein